MYSAIPYCNRIAQTIRFLIYLVVRFKDKRIARQYGYIARGMPPVVSDYSYARWTPRYSIISAISCDGLIANYLLKNPEERFETRSFIQFLDEQLLPAMNRFDGESPRSVLVMGEI